MISDTVQNRLHNINSHHPDSTILSSSFYESTIWPNIAILWISYQDLLHIGIETDVPYIHIHPAAPYGATWGIKMAHVIPIVNGSEIFLQYCCRELLNFCPSRMRMGSRESFGIDIQVKKCSFAETGIIFTYGRNNKFWGCLLKTWFIYIYFWSIKFRRTINFCTAKNESNL